MSSKVVCAIIRRVLPFTTSYHPHICKGKERDAMKIGNIF